MAENLGFGFGVREEVKEASGIKIRIYGSGGRDWVFGVWNLKEAEFTV